MKREPPPSLRDELPYFPASEALQARVRQALDSERAAQTPSADFKSRRRPSFWWGALSGALAAAIGTVFLVLPRPNNVLVEDLTSAHLRSLLPNHLLDVVSTDQHTVKPWFAGHADVSPPVVDLTREGYPLIGGRIDYVAGRRAAVVVYRHGPHLANVFVWADDGTALPRQAMRNGYRTACWHSGNLAFCAVTDMAEKELDTLTQLLKSPPKS